MTLVSDESFSHHVFLLEHEDWVQCVAWGPGGIVTGTETGELSIFPSPPQNTQPSDEGQVPLLHPSRRVSAAHDGDIVAVTWAPELTTFASASVDGKVKIWNANKGTVEKVLEGHSDAVRAIAFEEKGTVLASGSIDGKICLWGNKSWTKGSAAHPSPLAQQDLGSSIYSLSWSTKGRPILAVGTETGLVVVLKVDLSAIQALQNGVPGSSPPTSVMSLVSEYRIDGICLSVAWSPEADKIAAASSEGLVRVWDADKKELFSVHAHSDWVTCIAWSGHRMVTSGFQNDKSVKIWDVNTGKCLKTFDGHARGVTCVAWDVDGSRIISSSSDTTVRIWDSDVYDWGESEGVHDGENMKEGHDESVRTCAWSHDGKHVASGGDDNALRIWSAVTGERVCAIRDHGGWVNSVAWHPDNTQVVTGSGDKIVRIWDAHTGALIKSLVGHTDWVQCVAWSADGNSIASGAFELDKTVRVWSASSGQLVFSCEGHTDRVLGVAFSPDCKHIGSASADSTVRIWSAGSGAEEMILRGHQDAVNAVAWSPDGTKIASVSNDAAIKIWTSHDGQILRTLVGHEKWVYCISWGADSQQFVTGSEDHTVRLWNLASKSKKPPAGFLIDSPVFGLSWSVEQGVVCACASGRLVNLSIATKGESLSWAQSFKKTVRNPLRKNSRLARVGSVATQSAGAAQSESKGGSKGGSRRQKGRDNLASTLHHPPVVLESDELPSVAPTNGSDVHSDSPSSSASPESPMNVRQAQHVNSRMCTIL